MYECGCCFKCGRLMSIKWLESVEFHEGHFAPGEIHHKLGCKGCIKKAKQLDKKFERDSNKGRKFKKIKKHGN